MSAEITKCVSKDTTFKEDQKTDDQKRDKPYISLYDDYDDESQHKYCEGKTGGNKYLSFHDTYSVVVTNQNERAGDCIHRPRRRVVFNHILRCYLLDVVINKLRGSYQKSRATIFCKVTYFIIDKPNTPS